MIDSKRSIVLKAYGGSAAEANALDCATEAGLWREDSKSMGSVSRTAKLLWRCLGNGGRLQAFLITTVLLLISGYLEQLKTLLGGHLLTALSGSSEIQLYDSDPSAYLIQLAQ